MPRPRSRFWIRRPLDQPYAGESRLPCQLPRVILGRGAARPATGWLVLVLSVGLVHCLGRPLGAFQPTEPTTLPAAAAEPPATASEPPAAESTTSADEFVEDEPSYTRLADDEIAKRLELTPEQRSQIAQLLVGRRSALEKVDEDQRVHVRADHEQALRSVLTPAQRGAWRAYWREQQREHRPPAEGELRFNFRFQPWAEVLNWFAQQADLSLVLDAPPPGSFNYSDRRTYTVPEAIDLLNGVLLSKGYTLIRRERMLLLVHLAEGIPAEMIPQVTLEELADRGRYELVRVLFPLENRSADDVKAEITPLLGPHGKCDVLAKTRQVLVTETAGKMASIQAVINSIPQPPSPAPAAPSSPPEKPVLLTYPLGNIAPAAAVDVFKALLPDAKVVADPQAGQLTAYATPPQQEAIRKTLEQMQAELPPEKQRRLELHPLRGVTGSQALAVLQPQMTDAQLTVDAALGRLVAWATGAQHQQIESTLRTLRGGGAVAGADEGPRLEIYAIGAADPATLVKTLETMVPQARVTSDTRTKSLIVLATPEEHTAVRAALERLSAEPAPDLEPRLEVYPLPDAVRKRALAVLDALAGELAGVKRVVDEEAGTLSVWGRPEEQQRIREVLEQLAADMPQEAQRELAVYRLRVADPTSVLTVLQTLMPQAKLVADAKSRQLAVWARPSEQQQIARVIEQMDAELPAEQRQELMSHPVPNVDPSAAITLLRTLLPEVQVVQDTKTMALVAWARAADHRVIREALTRMQPTLPEEKRPKLVVYSTRTADPQVTRDAVQPAVPNAKLISDYRSNTLSAWATPEDQVLIAQAIEQLQIGHDEKWRQSLSVFPLKPAGASNVLAVLQSISPQALMRLDPKSGQLSVWARPAEHDTLRQAIQTLEAASPNTADLQLAAYPFTGRDASSMLALLQPIAPDVQFITDTKSAHLLAWAKPEDHERIRQALGQLAERAPAIERQTRLYRFQSADANAAIQVLRSLLPAVPMAVDTRTGALVATALPEEHTQLETAVRELDHPADATQERRLGVFPTLNADPVAIISMLQPLVPAARLSADRQSRNLAAWGTPQELSEIEKALAQIEGTGPEGQGPVLELYPTRTADPLALAQMLQPMFPLARINGDRASGTVAVLAPPREQGEVAKALERLERAGPESAAPVLVSYEIKRADPATLLPIITGMFAQRSDVRVSLDPKSDHILVWASPAQQALVRRAVDSLAAGIEEEARPPLEIQVYPLGDHDLQAVQQLLSAMKPEIPDARWFQDTRGGQLAVLARPHEQARVKAALERLQTAAPEVEVFQLSVVEARTAALSLRKLFESEDRSSSRGPRVDADSERQQLLVRGTREQLAQVRQTLAKMGESAYADPASGAAAPEGIARPRSRVVNIPRERLAAVLAEMERVWPQLRQNPIRVVSPAAESPTLRRPGQTPAPPNPAAIEPAVPAAPAEGALDASPPGGGGDDAAGAPPANTDPPGAAATATAAAPQGGASDAPAPIIVAPGESGVTIASDDPEALAQFESLLRMIAGQGRTTGRDFVVFTLQSASAPSVAELLKKLFGSDNFGFSFSGVVIAADERLNAVIVKANPNDLTTIENLLRVLDTSDIPDTLIANKPQRIELKHARALEVEAVIRDVYRAQLSSSGTRGKFPIPSGLSREQSAIFEQLNALATGPVLSVAVDEGSNSLVVLAPPPLLVEVSQLARNLDEAAQTSHRTVRVLPLERLSSESVDKALKLLLSPDGSSRRRSRRSYSSSDGSRD